MRLAGHGSMRGDAWINAPIHVRLAREAPAFQSIPASRARAVVAVGVFG